jgi:N-acetylneuraminate synthase
VNEFRIQDKKFGSNNSPFIVAEISGNHNQSLERALQIVQAAAASGVHAVKLQTYTADTITLDTDSADFFISDSNSLWKGSRLYDLYKKAYTPWEWHKPIMDKCKELGLICFSTPFDETAVDFLETLNVPCYKIASFEVVHLPMIKKIAQTGKPIIMSTGMASVAELDEAVKMARNNGCKDLILLKCTSSYPAEPSQSNILTIPHMQKLFDCQVGLSDHTLGIGVAVASVALGATFIEKHFTLSRADGGVDSEFSLEPEEMKNLVLETKRAWQALGQVCYKPSSSEEKSMQFRRSLYVAQDIKSGEVFTKDNLRIVRPGFGLSPKYYDEFLGKKVSRDLKKGTPVKWDIIS